MNSSYYGWRIFYAASPHRDVLYSNRLANTKAYFGTSIVFQVSARAEFCEELDRHTHNESCLWGMLHDSVY